MDTGSPGCLKTDLDSSLVYEYGLTFTRNELEEEDVTSFNHEFLLSMGISVAKHRLQILKLVAKEAEERPRRVSGLFSAINKAKRCVTRSMSRWAFPRESAARKGQAGLQSPFHAHWSGALREHHRSKEFSHEAAATVTNRSNMMRSGPLDRRVQERLMVTSRCLSVSGPLDGNLQERLMSPSKSPTASGPSYQRALEGFQFASNSPGVSWALDETDLSPRVERDYSKEKMVDDGNRYQPLWSLMFQDIKPT